MKYGRCQFNKIYFYDLSLTAFFIRTNRKRHAKRYIFTSFVLKMRFYSKNTIYLENEYFINIRNRDNTSYSILFGYCQRNIGYFFASGLPETGRKAIKKNCPLLFFHFGYRLVCNNLLCIQPSTVHLVEYRMSFILYFTCHLLLSDYPFPYPARTTGEFLPAPLCIARHTGNGYVNMVIIHSF